MVDDEVRAKTERRRQVYRWIASGLEELWEEYYRLRKEVKQLVLEKKLSIWNEVVEKANSDFEGNKKEFWAFVGRRTKGRKEGISALRSDTGVSVSSTKGKLGILQSHYERLGSTSVEAAFDDDWKEEVESIVRSCVETSVDCEDGILDREIDLSEISRCIRKLKIIKLVGVTFW